MHHLFACSLVLVLAPAAHAGPAGIESALLGFSSANCGDALTFKARVRAEGPLALDGELVANGVASGFKATKDMKDLSVGAGKLDCAKPLALSATIKGAGGREVATKTFAPAELGFEQVTKPYGAAKLTVSITGGGCTKPLTGWAALDAKGSATVKVKLGDETLQVDVTGPGTKAPWTASKILDCTKPLPALGFEATSKDGVASGTFPLKRVVF